VVEEIRVREATTEEGEDPEPEEIIFYDI